MNLKNLIAAISARWTAQSVGSSITGGLRMEFSDKAEDMPYCVYQELSATPVLRAAGEIDQLNVDEAAIRFVIHHNGGPAATAALAETLKSAFDNAPLSITGENLLYCRYAGEVTTRTPGFPSHCLHAVNYEILTSRSATLNPS